MLPKGILTYHVVSGRLGSKELARLIKEGSGTAEPTTVSGNGIIHVIEHVITPK